MFLTFLGAALPLTKTIVCRNGQYAIAPYPHVSKVTSYEASVKTLDDFYQALNEHAKASHCLLNGSLTQPLVKESRAQRTLKGQKRSWIVFDFDKVSAASAEEVVQNYLPECCRSVSYIVQHSASMFRTDSEHFSGHIFMLLKDPCDEQQLARWFEFANWAVPALFDSISLSSSGTALHWPLDRTAAYDSRITYIAPPRCHGFVPKIKADGAIKLVKKRVTHLALAKIDPVSKHQIDAKINELRQQCGMPTRDMTTRKFGDEEVLIDAEPGFVSDVRTMGEHYIKFNLNGGDSLGYWIDLRNPAIIRNFKGEPNLKTQEVDEKFFKSLAGIAPRVLSKPPPEDGSEVLAFYTRNQGSKIKIGMFSPGARELRLDDSTETAAGAWLSTFGLVRRGNLPVCDVEFDPTSEIQFVPGCDTINTFRATDYMVQPKSKAAPSTLSELPHVMKLTLNSVLGNPSAAELAHFINWLAYIFQTRKKTGTAWVWHGVEGTGKGKFVEFVLRPLFGTDLVKTVQFPLLDKSFNDFLDQSLFVIVDEATMKAIENSDAIMAKLQHWITDSPIMIEGKNLKARPMPNYSNFILCSNKGDPVNIVDKQRRFNVANRQPVRLVWPPNAYLALEQGTELEAFADMLNRWPVNEEQVRTLIETEASQTIHENTTNIGQLTAERLLAGDLQYFIDRAPSSAEAQSDFGNGRFNPLGLYNAFIDDVINGKKAIVTYEDLFVVFRTLIPDTRLFQDSKSWRLKYFKSVGLNTKPVWNNETRTSDRGLPVTWQVPSGAKPLQPKSKVLRMVK